MELKVYVMPDGVKRQYRENEVPKCAVPYEPEKPTKAKAIKSKKAEE